MTGENNLPQIPPTADEDIPPEGDANPPLREPSVEDPDRQHERDIVNKKHSFAMQLVWWCVAGAILVMIGTWVATGLKVDTNIGQSTLDFLKFLATTAAGYLFGQSVGGKNR